VTPYQRLGVDATADSEDIRRAYLRAVKQHHPDAGGDRATFEAVQRAYDLLSDPERRAKYDATGDDSERGPDNAHAAALGVLIAAMDKVMQEVAQSMTPVERMDVPAKIRAAMQNEAASRGAQRREATRAAKRAADMAARFGTTAGGAGSGVLADVWRQRAAQVDQVLRALDDADRVGAAALRMLDDVTWKRDEAPAPQGFSGSYMNHFLGSATA
jgi:DnaJ-class molecular chaperone